ncbi:EboA domain-containing protein [Streptomyces monomycini]|uniref:EboA domain-containing protein n=1 Tax=Streptomyces monomycini TaxID=371720 RepID=UPI001EEB6065|nr:EboA domain-containing protein [Streptomyces monomycini]
MAQLQTALRDRLGGAARAWLDEALDEAQAEARAAAQAGTRAAAQPEIAAQAAAQPGARAAGPAAAHPEGAARPEAAAEAAAAGPRGSAVSGAALSYTAYAPPVWEMRFASAGRHCTRREPPYARDREAAEAARILLLHTARADARTVTRLYEHGTAAERRAVLIALPHLDLGPSARPLVEDALRTDDTRLVAAAVGPYAARHLDAHTWRHAVLKCLFTGVPVTAVAGLAERARGDTELAHMLTAYARERTAAYRPVPADLQRVLDLTAPPVSTASHASPSLSDPAPAPAPDLAPGSSPAPGPSPDLAPTVAPDPASSHAAHDPSLQPPPVPPFSSPPRT